jgi:hypothetical protein
MDMLLRHAVFDEKVSLSITILLIALFTIFIFLQSKLKSFQRCFVGHHHRVIEPQIQMVG